MKTVIKQTSSVFNPYFLDGKEINHFVFFSSKEGKELFSEGNDINRWFSRGGSNNDFPEVHFPFEIKRRNKTDLTKCEAFIRPYEAKYAMDKGKIVIYIPIELLPNFKDLGEVFMFETDADIKRKRQYTFEVEAVESCHRLNKEEDKLEYYNDELKPCTLTIHDFYSTELKPLGQKIEQIEAALKAAGIDRVGSYDIEKMLEVCDITIK